MKRPNILIGLIGGIATIAIAPGLAIAGYHITAGILFITVIALIDWNRNGN